MINTHLTRWRRWGARVRLGGVPEAAADDAPIPVNGASFAIAITPDGKTVYADSGSSVTPISTATNKAGKPIRLNGNPGEGIIAITPDGKTAYVLTINPRTIVPISTATNTPGKPIPVRFGIPGAIAITP